MLFRHLRWGLAGALVAWTLIRAFGLERGWPLVPLFAFTPCVAVIAVFAAGLAAWARWWTGAAVAAACAAVLLALLVPRAVPDRAPPDTPGVRLRVLAANVAANDEAAGRVMSAVRRWDVDVFSVRRAAPRARARLRLRGRAPLFPHRALQPLPGFRAPVSTRGSRSRRPGSARHAVRGWRRRSCARPAPRRSRSSRSTCSRRGIRARPLNGVARCGRCRPRAQGRCACWPAISTRRSTTPSCGGARPRLPGRRRAGGRRATPHLAGRRRPRARARHDRSRAGRPPGARHLGPHRRDPGLGPPWRARRARLPRG